MKLFYICFVTTYYLVQNLLIFSKTELSQDFPTHII